VTVPPLLKVFPVPSAARPKDVAGSTAVVMDVLRASTTIIHSLANRASEVRPCREVEEARSLAKEISAETPTVTAGERLGLPIPGFDLGNAPEEFTSDRVRGHTVVFTTTNGTLAIHACQSARRTIIAAFVNAPAVLKVLLEGESPASLVCAGTNGVETEEDMLLAGWFARELVDRDPSHRPDREVERAIEQAERWRLPRASRDWSPEDVQRLEHALRESTGGRNLLELGREADIAAASHWGEFNIVPEFDPRRGAIQILRARKR
jgi:2-phosphosulfolactate phosphatase